MSPSKSKQKIGAEKSHQQAIKPRLMYNQPELRVLVFKILESEYVFDVSRIQEIIQPKELAHLDGIPGYVEGLLKRRGHIVPVVDLRKRLDLEIAPHTEESCVIVARLSFGLVGFLVDAVLELLNVQTSDFEIPSRLIAGISQSYLQGIAHLGDRLLVMLDFEQIFSPDEQVELGQLLDSAQAESSQSSALKTLFVGNAPEANTMQHSLILRSLLVFELADERYGLPVAGVSSVIEPLPMTPLPHVPGHILGLINLRGRALPVIDLRRRFGLAIAAHDTRPRLIVLRGVADSALALWADVMIGFEHFPESAFRPLPEGLSAIDLDYCQHVAMQDKKMVIELNLQKILDDLVLEGDSK